VKYLIQEIIKTILSNVPETAETTIIRLDYMPHPKIYLEVCRKLDKIMKSKGSRFTARLSKEKYIEFQTNPDFIPLLNQLKEEGYVDTEGRMTYWRNSISDESGIVLLMGTEVVEDRGGLADFYAITPNIIEQNLKDNYATWAEDFISEYNEQWKSNINEFLKRLFRYVPLDLLKLSQIFEDISSSGVKTHIELLNILCDRLYMDWSFPRIGGEHTLSARLKLLDQAYKFRERIDYKDGLTKSQLSKLNKRFDKFLDEHPDIINDYDYQYKCVFSSFEEFRKAVIDYTAGIDLERNRDLLFRCDFCLINSILKISIGNGPKTKTPKVYGSPLEVILKTMLQTCQTVLKEMGNVEKLIYKIKEISIAGCSTEEELRTSWLNITAWTGGVMKFISQEKWKIGDNELHISWDHDFDPFEPNKLEQLIKEGFISRASANKKLSKIEFDIFVIPYNKSFSYDWEFEPLNPWSQAFALLTGSLYEKIEMGGSSFIPFGICDKTAEITQLTNEDDFLAVIENIHVKFINLLDIITKCLPSESSIIGQVLELGEDFVKFVIDILEQGFYNTCADSNASGIRLVSHYEKVMEYLSKTNFNSMVEQQLHLLANAFLISPSLSEGVEQKVISSALVPPFHPAMLEKMHAQAQFIRQGASELFERLMSNLDLRIEYEFERLLQLSTITSSVDVLIGPDDKCLPVKNTFAYYCLYHDDRQDEILLSNIGGNNHDIVSDDTTSITELRRMTPLSKLFARQIKEYLNTYPFKLDELSLLFVNPPDLQPVVSGVHHVVQDLKKTMPKVQIRLYVLLTSLLKGARGYLRYWLDNFFSEEDNVHIKTYCITIDIKKLSSNKDYLKDIYVDIAFVQNLLQTVATKFEPMNQEKLPIYESRFPMVYPPLPVSKTSVQRLISASQTQFRAAHLHTQLVRKIINKYLKEDNYRIVKEIVLDKHWKTLLDILHKQAHWVVCVDSGIDRDIIHDSDSRIISFSTGEGPFGEYNFTISSCQVIKSDIARRLKAQLKRKFPGWSDESLEDIAVHCLEQSRWLDGIRLLRALNPNDYQIHNFLAYILTAQELKLTEDTPPDYAIRILINLDTYAHWFENEGLGSKQPDFLLLEIPKGENLLIKATLIECKMGTYSESHINKAFIQLKAGYDLFSKRWDPNSTAVDRRYWYAQLYRVLVFSKINLNDSSSEYEAFVKTLDNILSGTFSIQWNAKIFGFWLDGNYLTLPTESYQLSDDGLEAIYHPFGQLYIQKMLRSQQFREEPVTFLVPAIEDILDSYEEETKEFCSEDEYELVEQTIDLDQLDIDIDVTNDESLEEHNKVQNPVNLEAVEPKSDKFAAIHTVPEINSGIISNISLTTVDLKDVRVLIGEDIKTKEKIYWEYGHPQLPNRHILISGNSGTGKTYLIQCMMLELARSGISCMVFDYTDGFTESKLEPEFKDYLKDRIIEFPVYNVPFPINPFRRYDIEVAGKLFPQKNVDVAERIKSIFQAVYAFGDQQASAIYKATRNGLKKYGEKMNLNYLRSELQKVANEIPNAKTVLSKIEPLVDREPFNSNEVHDWSKFRENKGTIFIVQLSGFTRDIQLIITEMILWDAWYYNVKHGRKDLPFPVILDEAQNLDHSSRSPTTMILTEGRKFGWSGWFATQFMKNQLKVDEIQRLQQASQKIYFNPPEAEIPNIVANIEPDRAQRSVWHTKLSQLRKGECVVVGYELRNGKLEKRHPRIVKVTSLSERIRL